MEFTMETLILILIFLVILIIVFFVVGKGIHIMTGWLGL